jgi:uncharacterized membrane protein
MWLSRPYYLLLLLVVPVFWWFSLPQKEFFPRLQFYLLNSVRSLIIVLLVLALAGLKFPLKMFNELTLMFVTDYSSSISASDRQWTKNYIRRTLSAMKGKDKVGWISFGRQAYLEQKPVNKSEALEIIENEERWDKPAEEFTNIEAALSLGVASVPEDGVARIILFSDGNENVGQAERAAGLARNRGIKIYPVLPPQQRPQEVLLEQISVPERVMVKEAFSLKLNIANLGLDPCRAKLKILRNRQRLVTTELTLSPGLNYFSYDDVLKKTGVYQYTAFIEAACDANENNNQIMAQVMAAGTPKILCIDGHKGRSSFLAKALKLKGVEVIVEGSKHIPKQLSQLAGIDALVFNNVSRSQLSKAQMEMIKDYVADMGGGFVMIGGEDSFSAGGYAKTTIEQILPVNMGQNVYYKFKQMLLVLLIDRSSSMEGEKISLAREAALKVVNQLRDNDMLGIILFDSHYQTLVELQLLWRNRRKIIERIKSIRTGRGGTNIYPALRRAYQMLKSAHGFEKLPMQVKHIILLSDGKTYGGDFDKLAAEISRDRMSVSSIAIGSEADVALLARISQVGKGLFHHPEDVSKLPQVFLTDIESTISKSPFVEKPSYPRLTPNTRILKGIEQKTIPPLKGYMVTTPKPGAEVVLISDTRRVEDPILAIWRYGLGKTVAYTSDVDGRWSAKWIGWTSFSRFWSQVIRSCMRRDTTSAQLDISAHRTPEGGILEVELLPSLGTVGELEAVVWGPDKQRQELKLRRTGRGKYQAPFEASQPGLYMISIKGRREGERQNLKTAGVILSPFLDEYRRLRPNERLLKRLASISGGQYNPERNEVFLTPPPEIYQPQDIWQLLVVAAMVLFVADVAIRRLWL